MKWISFLGTGQSGHTAVAACLDAHPNVIIAEEQSYVKKLISGRATKEKLIWECTRYCKSFKTNTTSHRKKDIPINSPYCGTWRDELLCIGNKMGWEFTGPYLKRGRSKFPGFCEKIEMPVKVIHVVRNPFDNIASWALTRREERVTGAGKIRKPMSLDDCIQRYENHTRAALEAIYPYTKLKLVHIEKFCDNVDRELREICLFLDIPFDSDWSLNCAKAIFDGPRIKRDRINWSSDQTSRIREIINSYQFLREYK